MTIHVRDEAGGMLTVQDLARMCHACPDTVRRWVKAGRLPRPVGPGRRLLWDRGTIERHLTADRQGQNQEGATNA